MSVKGIDDALSRMQTMARLAAGEAPGRVNASAQATDGGPASVDFSSVLRDAVREVNAAQNTAQAKVQAFQTGEQQMSLEEVMVSLQKANIAFQGMIAVRNRMVDAYRDVTNLQV